MQVIKGNPQRLYRLSLPRLKTAAKLLNISLIDSLREYLQRSALNGILFLLLLVFTGAAIFSFIGFAISELFLGIPLLTDPTLIEKLVNPELLPALRVMQVLQAVGMLIIPAGIYLWLTSSWPAFKTMFGSPSRQPVLLSVAIFMVAFPFINYLAQWNEDMELPFAIGEWMHSKESQAGALTEMFLDMPNVGLLFFNLFMIALLPAIGEELIFRGIVQRGLIRQFGNAHLGIWLAAIVFSAIHFQFLGFIPRMLMGVALGYLFYWSKNLWYPIIAHFTNNAVAIILAYGVQHGSIDSEMEMMGSSNAGMSAFSLLFCMMLLYLFNRYQEVENNKIQA